MLTISDVKQVANFSQNSASLKQIDEEIESSEDSSNESEYGEQSDGDSIKSSSEGFKSDIDDEE